jgi:hypothetical protein
MDYRASRLQALQNVETMNVVGVPRVLRSFIRTISGLHPCSVPTKLDFSGEGEFGESSCSYVTCANA